jgi:hypothetical protein
MDERIILKIWDVVYIHLAQDRCYLQALVNTVMSSWVPKKCKEFLS